VATLKKNPAGEYVVRFWTNGRGSRLEYVNLGAIPYAEAVKRAAKEIAAGKTRRAGDRKMTFSDLADSFLKDAADRLSPRGADLVRMIVTQHLKPFFGALRAEAIKAADVERFRRERRQLVRRKCAEAPELTDLPVSPSTFNREWSTLRAILNWGERTELIDRNPIRRGAVKLLRTEPRTVFFEPEEWRSFLDAAAGHDELRETVAFWRALLLTGSRIGEIAALRWADVDLERKLLAVRQAKTAKTKTKTLVIGPALDALLRSLVRGVGSAPVFIRANGDAMTREYLQTAFDRTMRHAGFEGQHGKLTPHAIRHTAATWMRREGVALDRVQEILGHADNRMTLRYAHIRPVDLGPALDVLAAVEERAGEIRERTVNENRIGEKRA
jgi:integrase